MQEPQVEEVQIETPLDCKDQNQVQGKMQMKTSNEAALDHVHCYSSVPLKGNAVDRKHLEHLHHSDQELEASCPG